MSTQNIPDLQKWIEQARAQHATDLFFLPGEPPAWRVDGRIVRTDAEVLTTQDVEAIAVAAVGRERADRVGRDTPIAYANIRLNDTLHAGVSVSRSGGRLTVWAWPMSNFVFDVARLSVPQPIVETLSARSGLLIVTGPTGSGKTTTCYSLLEHLNTTRDVHIIMAEYAPSFVIEPKRALIQQRQVGTDAPDMLGAIHSALFQDADVLFVGEIREVEVLQACLNAAESGHLVLTQLHQRHPEAALMRMIDLQPEDARSLFRQMLSRQLLGLLAQTLLPRADRPGRVPAYGALLPDNEMREAIATGHNILDRRSPLPSGCLEITAEVARLQREGLVSEMAAREALSVLG